MTYAEAQRRLQEISQEQLLRFWDELNDGEKEGLLKQIEDTDFSVIRHFYCHEKLDGRGRTEPIRGLRLADIRARRAEFVAVGKAAIRAGKVGAVLLAGGQGTRLGFDGPKGAFDIGVTAPLYIFEQQVRNLLEVVRECGAYVPLYIMTSDLNHDATVKFWREHDYFSYPAQYVRFFVQEMAPAVDKAGKVLLAEKGSVALSPNGNGGWLSSMRKCGLLEDVSLRGI